MNALAAAAGSQPAAPRRQLSAVQQDGASLLFRRRQEKLARDLAAQQEEDQRQKADEEAWLRGSAELVAKAAVNSKAQLKAVLKRLRTWRGTDIEIDIRRTEIDGSSQKA